MGLFNGYFDPQQFGEGGGLLARLRAVQSQMGQDQTGAGFGQSPPITQSPSLQPTLWPNLSDAGQALFNPQPAAPNPFPPGSQFAQAPISICPAGPVGGASDMGISTGQILGGVAGLLAGGIILNNNASRPPAGSRPIDQTDWSGDHTEIKQAVRAQGNADVRISPTGEVWAQKPDGSWENHGPAADYTGSGKPSGRRGKDRDR
jgi:hypothetical protein